jgi:Flp pilus assembly protein TadD
MRVGESALQAGDVSLAATMFRKAIALNPELPDAHLRLADALSAMQDYAGADQEYQSVLGRDPNNAPAEVGLGRLDLARHHPDAALTKFRAAAVMGAAGPSIDNLIGYSLDLVGDHKQAQASYVAGLALNPDDKVLRNNYGLSLTLSGNYPKAIEVLTALAQEPDATPRNRENLALALGLSGDAASARAVAAHDLGPTEIQNNLRYYDYVRGRMLPESPAAP